MVYTQNIMITVAVSRSLLSYLFVSFSVLEDDNYIQARVILSQKIEQMKSLCVNMYIYTVLVIHFSLWALASCFPTNKLWNLN